MTEDTAAADRLLLRLLAGWVEGATLHELPPGSVAAAAFRQSVQRHRLDPLFSHILARVELTADWLAARNAFDEAYRRCLLHGVKRLNQALEIVRELEQHGVPAIALRGPFAGVSFYGDVGLRYFTDVDLLIHRRDKRTAWDLLRGKGFSLSNPVMTKGVYDRHHLQWPLANAQSGLQLDLHWALDHPYKLLRIDYDNLFAQSHRASREEGDWREAGPVHQVLLSCIHLMREQPFLTGDPAVPNVEAVVADCKLTLWAELALLVARHGPGLDWGDVVGMARRWRVAHSLRLGLCGVRRLFGDRLPVAATACLESLRETQADASWAAPRSGTMPARLRGNFSFRRECVSGALRYLFPPADFFEGRNATDRSVQRISHLLRGMAMLCSYAGDALCCWCRSMAHPLATRRKRKTA